MRRTHTEHNESAVTLIADMRTDMNFVAKGHFRTLSIGRARYSERL
jgi:hypothetical protein